MPHAIRIHATGGPEVLVYEEVAVGDAGPGRGARSPHGDRPQLHRHLPPQRPLSAAAADGHRLGGRGRRRGRGPGVDWVKAGDRVAYCGGPLGAYATERVMPADRLVKVPDGIDDVTAATLMLKGLTVQYLFRQTYPLKAGETILFHAAAGGVGLIACQWARALGVTMIGTVGSDEKAALAKANGCAHTIVYTREDFVATHQGADRRQGRAGGLRRHRQGHVPGVARLPVAARPVRELRQRVGSVPPFNIMLLAQKGSLYATRPTLFSYAVDRASTTRMAEELFALVLAGKIKSEARQRFALKDAASAHRALESRATTGATVLLP